MDNVNAMNMFLALGELTNEKVTREDKLEYQERIVFATMRANIPDWQPPSDWYELPIEEREERIKKLKTIK
tara:strand:+ start:655 stop:867 length:213 start_codon:yes stop_codon:yes gene_type:complete